jgi:hypothetical protein
MPESIPQSRHESVPERCPPACLLNFPDLKPGASVTECAQASPDPAFPVLYLVQNTTAILLEPLDIQISCICSGFRPSSLLVAESLDENPIDGSLEPFVILFTTPGRASRKLQFAPRIRKTNFVVARNADSFHLPS